MTVSHTASLRTEERAALAAWIGERPGTVLPMHALRSGLGRVSIAGDPASPDAVLVESALVPGEPQGFGDSAALLGLLERTTGWTCVEVESELAASAAKGFADRWGPPRLVTDVVHVLEAASQDHSHGLVRKIQESDLNQLSVATEGLFPDRDVLTAAVAAGRVFGAIDGGQIVGHGSSFASGTRYADIGVHVHAPYRGRGIATSAASMACRAVQTAGLMPVWGAGSHNQASLRVAAKLGFVEVARLTYLVRSSDQ